MKVWIKGVRISEGLLYQENALKCRPFVCVLGTDYCATNTIVLGADPFGYPTLYRPWDDGSDSMENAKRRLRAGFEFFKKLGVCYQP